MEINIALSSDRHYCKLLATTIVSIFENNQDVDDICVYCLLFDVGENDVKEIRQIATTYGRMINIIHTSHFCEIYRFWEYNEDGRYVRLLLPLLLPSIDKVLYLDCDTIVRHSLSTLFKYDLSGYYHAAVLDTARMNARVESWIDDTDKYFNSGVMLINLKKWREDNIIEKFKSFKLIHSDKGIYRDQRILNGTISNNYIILPPEFNYMPEMRQFSVKHIKRLCGLKCFYDQNQIDKAIKDPIIVHFAGRSIDRPWFINSEHPFTVEYRNYMKKTEYTYFELWKDSWKNVFLWKAKKYIPFFILNLLIKEKNK